MVYDLAMVLLGLNRSNINFDIHRFGLDGVEVSISDSDNQLLAVSTFEGDKIDNIATWLHEKAIEKLPNSEYAKVGLQ